MLRNNVIANENENVWTLDNDKATYLGSTGNARCTLEFDNFWHE